MPSSPEEMRQAIVRNLPSKTGRSLEEWLALIREQAPGGRQRVEWLKREHRLGHVTAGLLVELALREPGFVPPTDAELIDAQYAGPRQALRPVYERVVAAVTELGSDVSLGARQSYVSFGRRRQFGLVQASTRARVDVGLALPAFEPTERLRVAGTWGSDNITHRVALSAPDEVDEELRGWLRAAYERGG